MSHIRLGDRLKHAWNAFRNRDPTPNTTVIGGEISSYSVGTKHTFSYAIDRSIVSALYTRIALDVAALEVRHIRIDENDRYLEEIKDGLDYCLTQRANIDQTSRAFLQDCAMSLFDNGVIAIVPVETTLDPLKTGGYDINQLRVGTIVNWYPEWVRVLCYNEKTGRQEEVTLPKRLVAIVENPLYSIMNEPNGTVKRLISKMNMLDAIDKQVSSGKLDIIIQLPYVVKSETKKKQAEERRTSIEEQLTNSKYGIAYIDATEKVVQLNRPAENNLMEQIEWLTKLLYSQLGISEEVFNGTAEESAMINYYNRTVEVVAAAIVDAMNTTFLTKTARSQGQAIQFYRDPFKLVPVSQIAEIADKFTRNEILSSNDIRSIIGYKPSNDPRADELRNKNLNADNDQLQKQLPGDTTEKEENVSIAHHGIKGMKWGVRRTPEQLGHRTPKSLSDFMRKEIDYSEFIKLKDHDEVAESKTGDCHSQVMYEIEELRKQGLTPKADFFIEVNPDTGQGGTTHSYVYYETGGKTYWFENAWGGHEGVHEYDSRDAMRKDIEKIHFSEQGLDAKQFTEIVRGPFVYENHHPGESLQELVDICLQDID